MIIQFFATGPGHFTGMMIESQMNPFHIGKVGGDVGVGNQDRAVLHVLWVDEFDIINDVEVLLQYGANQTVEIIPGNQSKHIVAHSIHPSLCLPSPFKGFGLNDRIILTIHSAK
jgi:hypothetical protein